MKTPYILFTLGFVGIALLAGLARGIYLSATELVCEGETMEYCTHR